MISVKVRTLTSLLIACAALPQAVLARDVEVCANLYRRLNSTPQIIGTTSTVRRYAQDLSAMNADIRQLRIDMRRQGCGGSIVTLGENSGGGDECGHMQETLQRIEDQRAGLTEQRNNSRSLLQPSEERVAILSAIRANSCTPTDLDTQTELEKEERIKIRGIALPGPDEPGMAGSAAGGSEMHLPPRDDAGSSITHIGSSQPVTAKNEPPIAFPPDRPFDPERKVRTIGPQFFPDENIDLANPKSSGPQPQQ
jgi:hypothetical protein